MKRFFLILFAVGLISFSKAQKLEVGPFIGATIYQGDLVDQFSQDNVRFGVGAFVRYNFNPFWSIRGGFDWGQLRGSDKYSDDIDIQKRNLSFESNISDLYIQGEYNFKGFDYDRSTLHKPVRPYVFLGLTIFRFDPMAYYNGEWHALQPLGTEGQGLNQYPGRKPYRLTQFGIPVGAGVKYKLGYRFNMAFEIKFVKTFTDYLDDVSTTYVETEYLRQRRGSIAVALSDRSRELGGEGYKPGFQRGNPKNKDMYAFAGFTFTYILRKKHSCMGF